MRGLSPITKRRRLGALVLAILAGAGIWRWIAWLHSPQRVVRQVAAAIERGDARILHALILDREKQEFGITEGVVQRVLQEILYRYAPAVKSVPSTTTRGYDGFRAVNWYRAHHAWADAATGQPLPSGRG